jgi:glucosamine--fructose-6-phosphate aminotransferase (isomerizing)
VASEFRYRNPPLPKGGVCIFISQSGETADTIAAHIYAKSKGQYCIGLINVPQSTLDRTVDCSLLTHAGPEIGVASTKAFIAQLTVLACVALHLGQQSGRMADTAYQAALKDLLTLPNLLEKELAQEARYQKLAKFLAKAQDVLYLGRGTSYAIALEGALKLKEITYIHAEGYAAGEMKHGPIALIDDQVPIVVVAPSDPLLEKTLSNVQEAAARQGQIILLSDAAGCQTYHGPSYEKIALPDTSAFTAPLLYTIPIQLLAYHTAVHKGTDVDQPRNLAKSVTVE